MEQFDNTVKKWLSYVDNNEYMSTALSLFLILYASLAAPKLPGYIAMLFDKVWFKLIIFFLIAYSARKNPTTALIASIGLMISLETLNRYKMNAVMHAQGGMGMGSGSGMGMGSGSGMDMLTEGKVVMEEVSALGEGIVEESLSKMGCSKMANYKNSFYPQYVNMKPDAYMARYTGNTVAGFDTSAKYAAAK